MDPYIRLLKTNKQSAEKENRPIQAYIM